MRIAITTLTTSPAVANRDSSAQKTQEIEEIHTFARINKGGTELEGECIGRVNSEEHDTEGTALPDSGLEVDNLRPQDVDVVK